MNDELRDLGSQAMYNVLFRLWCEGSFTSDESARREAMTQAVLFMTSTSKDELVGLICASFDETIRAQVDESNTRVFLVDRGLLEEFEAWKEGIGGGTVT